MSSKSSEKDIFSYQSEIRDQSNKEFTDSPINQLESNSASSPKRLLMTKGFSILTQQLSKKERSLI